MAIETNELLRYCRKRLRQLYPAGQQPLLLQTTRAELMQEAARGRPRVIARGQADIFAEIISFVLHDMGENMKYAPYVLQAWIDGVYFYYHGLEVGWLVEHTGATTYPSFFEAEAYIMQNFDPNDARDSILVVPLSEVERDA